MEMETKTVTAVGTLLLASFIALYFFYKVLRGGRGGGTNKLPPGSRGVPFIGETLQLIIPSRSLDLPSFFSTRIQRYGSVFRTHLVGRHVVVSADPDFNRYVVQQEGKSVEMWYMDSFSKMFAHDGEARTNEAGYIHKYIRNVTLSHFGSECLREKLLGPMEESIDETLHSWCSLESVDVKTAVLSVIVDFTAKQLFSYDPEKTVVKLGEKFVHLSQGLMSFPLNIPGTTYHRCLKDREVVTEIIRTTLKERLASPVRNQADFLNHLISDQCEEKFLTEDFMVNIVFGLLLASSMSTSVALTLVLKFLAENPPILEELLVEHENVLKRRGNPTSPLTWKEVKLMTTTLHVINESFRLGNPSLGLLRRTLKDITINSYTIPAGWTIMLLTSASQYNPNIFHDPLTFNPSRWKDLEPDVVSKSFMPFGGGIRQCAGAEFSKIFMVTFVYVLLTKYRWKKIKGGDIARTPFVAFPNGLRIKVAKQVF